MMLPATIFSQTIPIDHIREEQMRIQQLLNGSLYSSFTNRPVWNHTYDSTMAKSPYDFGIWTQPIKQASYGIEPYFKAGIYIPEARFTVNTALPYGENNESAWYGKGFNSEWTAGFWVTSDYLTVTFRPRLSNHQNLDFKAPRFIPTNEQGEREFVAEGIGDIIDRPYRFGPDPFGRASLGYTSIRAHFRMFEAGYSNEPLWWGGNVKYPLVMSNNAPGMRHIFAGTRSPMRIPYVGKFEFKYLLAFPEDSDYFEPDEERFDLDRIMNGINLSWSPAFAPNLTFGITRAIHTYMDENGLLQEDFTLILDPLLLKNFLETRGPLDEVRPRNHLNSIYGRWIWPESMIEIYGEYFRDDYAWDSRDLLMEPRHNSGYAFGFQKLILSSFSEFVKLHMEFTNMTPSYLEEVRRQDYYYADRLVPQGHTNRGQVLGAAIGPGSNSQYLGLDAYFERGRGGLFIRRLSDNNHFHFEFDRALDRPEEFRQGFGDYWRNRTDLTIGARGLYTIRNFIFRGELSWTKLLNYGRFDYGEFGGLNIANFVPNDLNNFQFQVAASYRF
jgi:hypothetical protein